MRRLPLVVCLCAAAAARPIAVEQEPRPGEAASLTRPIPQERLQHLERWLKAVARHEPGEADADLEEVGAWSNADLKALYLDVNVLIQIARRGHAQDLRFTQMRYSREQARRLSVLSCAADGALL